MYAKLPSDINVGRIHHLYISHVCVCEHEGSGETVGERGRERESSAQNEVRAEFVTDS